MPKRKRNLAPKDIRPGLRFRYGDMSIEILRDDEREQDRFGQDLHRWWSRDLGTGKEGYISLGPTGKLYNVEILDSDTKKSAAQLGREVAEVLAKKPPGHATKRRSSADIEPGLRGVAQRSVTAENRFLDYAMEHGRLSREEATAALAAFRKAKVIKLDAVTGTFHVKHGQFLDPDVLRRAAGLEE